MQSLAVKMDIYHWATVGITKIKTKNINTNRQAIYEMPHHSSVSDVMATISFLYDTTSSISLQKKKKKQNERKHPEKLARTAPLDFIP